MVTLEPGRTLLDLTRLELRLQELLGRRAARGRGAFDADPALRTRSFIR